MKKVSSTRAPRMTLAAIPAAAMLWALAQSASAQALAGQSVEDRLNTLMRVVDEQQRQIQSLERQVTELEMAQRGRGVPGAGAPAGSDTVAEQPGADGLPVPLPPLAQIVPGAPAPGGTTGTATGVPVNPPTPDGSNAGSTNSGGLPPATDGSGAVGQTQRANEPVRTQAEQAVVQREHAPLFDHKLTMDFGISDTYYDRRQLQLSGFLALDAIFLGNINLGQTKSHQVMADLDTRYGVSDRINVDVDVPYVYRRSNFIVGGAGGAASTLSDATVSSHDIGDVNFGLYYQFVRETNAMPDVVGSLRVKAPTGSSPFGEKVVQVDQNNTNLVAPTKLPTGTGFWNITAGLSVLKTYDPVVLFGSVSYTYNFARSFADISSVQGQTEPATVKLGDIVQFGGGVALAFSDKDSASVSFTMALEPESQTKAPGGSYQRVPGSETTAAAMNFGLNHVVNKHLTINGSVSIGLTPDAPNFVVGVRFPYTF
ncbi:SlyX family protein [Paraburkholderia sp. HP33-1]|uniref:SlyX family protein n=1 Tax=Paraburkholderia sp. HP33-1 TaxID=2883243 RepID=UPI001F44F055|nr:SlyX family protein [Paraburkholderia sp. HP33-1]